MILYALETLIHFSANEYNFARSCVTHHCRPTLTIGHRQPAARRRPDDSDAVMGASASPARPVFLQFLCCCSALLLCSTCAVCSFRSWRVIKSNYCYCNARTVAMSSLCLCNFILYTNYRIIGYACICRQEDNENDYMVVYIEKHIIDVVCLSQAAVQALIKNCS
jgi:hypothetical protein